MTRRLRTLFQRIAVCLVAGGAGACAAEPPPMNVLFVVVDDLGWADTGVYGSPFYETPAIDRLAREGARFTDFYSASPVCSPTRASIMTGRHPARLGITDWIGGSQRALLRPPANVGQLALEETTIGEAFQAAGYATGYAGKWHLGAGDAMPSAQGFIETAAVNGAGQPSSYFHPYRGNQASPRDVPDLQAGQAGDYLTDTLTDVALEFIDRHQSEPFFYVLSHYAVHTPIQAPEAVTDRYRRKRGGPRDVSDMAFEAEGPSSTKLKQDHATYAAMVENVDAGIGRLLNQLELLGLADRTAVVLVSDNGGLSTLVRGREAGTPTSNTPLRAGKGWLYEGGIRVPLIVRWPRVTRPGSILDVPGTTTDLFPTLLDIAGLPARPEQHVDGRSLAPVLRGDPASDERPLFWHFPHYHGSGNTPTGAVRLGDYKLIEWFESDRVELYRLDRDPGERSDLTRAEPDTARQLLDLLRQWRDEVAARMPTPNPDWSGGPG